MNHKLPGFIREIFGWRNNKLLIKYKARFQACFFYFIP